MIWGGSGSAHGTIDLRHVAQHRGHRTHFDAVVHSTIVQRLQHAPHTGKYRLLDAHACGGTLGEHLGADLALAQHLVHQLEDVCAQPCQTDAGGDALRSGRISHLAQFGQHRMQHTHGRFVLRDFLGLGQAGRLVRLHALGHADVVQGFVFVLTARAKRSNHGNRKWFGVT